MEFIPTYVMSMSGVKNLTTNMTLFRYYANIQKTTLLLLNQGRKIQSEQKKIIQILCIFLFIALVNI